MIVWPLMSSLEPPLAAELELLEEPLPQAAAARASGGEDDADCEALESVHCAILGSGWTEYNSLQPFIHWTP